MKKLSVVFRKCVYGRFFSSSLSNSNKENISNAATAISNRRNPFNKLSKKYNEKAPKFAERLSITILGNGAFGHPRCLCIFTEQKCYMFNCGEGVMRLVKEHGIQCLNARHIFITEKSWENLAGLSDLYVTQTVYGIRKLTIHGPPNIEHFLELNSSTMKNAKVSIKTIEDSPYCTDELEITYVPIYKKEKRSKSKRFSQKAFLQPPCEDTAIVQGESDFLVSYICKVKPKPGDFSPQKCIEHGVPVGPLLLQLKNGEDITLPSGKLVCSQDVHEAVIPGVEFLVIDCPYESMVDAFINEAKFKEFENKEIFAVFHFSPSNIVNSYKYKKWMHNFSPNTRHIMLNTDNSTFSSEAVHEIQHVLNMFHPEIFPHLHEKQSKPCSYPGSNYIQAENKLQFHVRPEYREDRTNFIELTPEKYLQRALDVPNFSNNLEALHESIQSIEKGFQGRILQKYPEIVFLGTSSATSTAYRNVTSIMVHISEENSIILDCGEGTYQQLLRFFGHQQISSVLSKISCVFISHQHLDHYLGFFQLCKARKEAFVSSSRNYVPLYVFTNCHVERLIRRFHRRFQTILQDIRLIPCNDLVADGSESDNSFLKDVMIETVPVIHCHESYGIVLTGQNWKVTYSGDCAPSQSLIDAGQNCDLLIHEASVDEGLINEAAFRLHSTTDQVIEVAERMNAQHTIITHFSKRYLVAPCFPEAKNISCAFDNMKVSLHQLPLLPLFVPTLKSLFSTLLEQHKEKSAATVSFEKVFFKKVEQHA